MHSWNDFYELPLFVWELEHNLPTMIDNYCTCYHVIFAYSCLELEILIDIFKNASNFSAQFKGITHTSMCFI